MPNLQDLIKDYDTKVGEHDGFLKSHKTSDGYDFTEAEGLEFQRRETELGQMHDKIRFFFYNSFRGS